MNIVKESIQQFRRGTDPKQSLNLGANKVYIDWWIDNVPNSKCQIGIIYPKLAKKLEDSIKELTNPDFDFHMSRGITVELKKGKYWASGNIYLSTNNKHNGKITGHYIDLSVDELGDIFLIIPDYMKKYNITDAGQEYYMGSWKIDPIKMMTEIKIFMEDILENIRKFENKNIDESLKFRRGKTPKDSLTLGTNAIRNQKWEDDVVNEIIPAESAHGAAMIVKKALEYIGLENLDISGVGKGCFGINTPDREFSFDFDLKGNIIVNIMGLIGNVLKDPEKMALVFKDIYDRH